MSLPAFTTQLPGLRQVVQLGPGDLHWSYDSDHPMLEPRKFFGTGRSYAQKVGARPGYGHDVAQVEDLLERLHEFTPLCAPVTVSVATVEDSRGSNGWARQDWDYSCYSPDACECEIIEERADGTRVKTRNRNWDGVILLSGRAAEIHPAIARYVVPHEYAHLLEEALGLIRHDGSSQPGVEIVREWAKVRRIPPELFDLKYGTTTHHLVPAEVFANDFRFMFGAETEWWPHHEVVRPLGERGTKRALRWWDDALEQLRDCYRQAEAALAAV